MKWPNVERQREAQEAKHRLDRLRMGRHTEKSSEAMQKKPITPFVVADCFVALSVIQREVLREGSCSIQCGFREKIRPRLGTASDCKFYDGSPFNFSPGHKRRGRLFCELFPRDSITRYGARPPRLDQGRGLAGCQA